MPKGYWVTTYRSIKDPDKLAAYAKLAPVALAPFGAKYIVRGAAVAASEAGIKQRVVISVFDNVSQAIAAHDSPAYQAAVKVLGDGAELLSRCSNGDDICRSTALVSSSIPPTRCLKNDRLWPIADVLIVLTDVRFRG